jgi:hypothetical protein
MNLNDLNGDIEIPKPWLNIVTNTCSSLFGSYMNGGFPCSFQNFSQVQPFEQKNFNTRQSIIKSPIVAPNYGDLSYPILSSGVQIEIIVPFLFQMTSFPFSIALFLNGSNIVQFPITTNQLTAVTGVFKFGISYDEEDQILVVYITGGISNSSTITTLSQVSYLAGFNNDFDIRIQFNNASPTNSFTAYNISSETKGLFNSA